MRSSTAAGWPPTWPASWNARNGSAPDAAARERERLRALLGGEDEDDGDGAAALSARLARRIRADDDPEFQRRAWDALVAIARDDLAIAKPGHDAWEGI